MSGGLFQLLGGSADLVALVYLIIGLAVFGAAFLPGNSPIYRVATLVVGGESDNGLTIVRGDGTYSYSCTDKCRSTPMVGDAPQHFSDVMATVTAKQQTARGN